MKRVRVMLAEDHDAVADQLLEILSQHYDVAVVRDGELLAHSIDRSRPDVVVTDIAMPKLSGLLVAREALQRDPGLPIVFVTVNDTPAVIRHALAMGARGYVLKCDAGEELLSAVAAARLGRQYLSAHARAVLSTS